MQLGAFSVSLAVNDIKKSKEFYEKLGFRDFGGEIDQNWLIMKNGDVVIGLFQGMFEKNILTFNPGWDQNANEMDSFTDAREILEAVKEQGIDTMNETVEGESGPASFVMVDPDGNPILIDQHV
jgi:lactoylglutathione lyase